MRQFEKMTNPSAFNRNRIPEPILDEEPGLVDLYWKAWELAWDHVREDPGAPQTPYMDEAHWTDTIWIWDTCFMMHFCKYAMDYFPCIESLQNFYGPMHDGSSSSLFIHHPDNPPLFGWAELSTFLHSGNRDHLKRILLERRYLQKHYRWVNRQRPGRKYRYGGATVALKKEDVGYRWSGNRSGMDNTPRGRGDYMSILWIDLIAQQALSAECIMKMASILNEKRLERFWSKQYDALRSIVNRYYWCEKDGIYYDIGVEKSHQNVRVKTPASYWPMLAGLCDEKQAARLAVHAADPGVFGGDIPWSSVSRDDPDFDPLGNYWRGGVWLPMAYMATKALERYGYYDLADALATNIVRHQYQTFVTYDPHTIWEVYSPTESVPSTREDNQGIARPDFCGWSALGPISLFIENVLGFHRIDAFNRIVEWRKYRSGRQGIRRLRFGSVCTDIVAENNRIEVNSTEPFTLFVNQDRYVIQSGNQVFFLTSG